MKTLKGTESVDLHGKNRYQARVTLDAYLRRVPGNVYRVVVVHGHHMGTELRDMVREEYASHPKVRRIETGGNPGETVLVLKEKY